MNKELNMYKMAEVYTEIIITCPEFVTQQQAAIICNVNIQTIRKLEKTGILPYKKKQRGTLHYHEIPLTDVLKYLYKRDYWYEVNQECLSHLRDFYVRKYNSYSDCLYTMDIVRITGYCKTTVQNWIISGKLRGYRGQFYRIAKTHFIDFLCSQYYNSIRRKSKIHKAELERFQEEHQILMNPAHGDTIV